MTQVKNIMKYDYVQICQKIIIDYRLLYLNDLFGIEIIFYDPSQICNF